MVTRTLLRLALVAATLLAVPRGMTAQDSNAVSANNPSPMRAARLVSLQGNVTVTDGNNPPAAAQTNLPLLQGVQIATGDDGQAEIEFEDGSVARLTPNSTLALDRLDIAPGQLFVTDLSVVRGLAYFELRATPEYTYSVNAGDDLISPVENATVRVDFDQPPAKIAVMEGTVQVERANAFKVNVAAGATFRENANDPSHYFVTQEIAADSWDQWNADMDQQAAQQSGDTSVRNDYAGAQGYGWGDLDNQGTWYDVPGQGQVWQPYGAEDASFDPYGYGSWVWYPGAGYLWASGYPWGWTPYRCGAWSYYDAFGWGWAPGATCGGFGWGFAGGGFVVNIVRYPRGYRPVRVPIARPGPIRPVIPVRAYVVKNERRWSGPAPNRQPRQIAGVTAKPILPGHVSFAAGGGGNVSLHRDFPIDRTTHAPAMGVTATRPPNVYRVGPGNGQQVQSGQQQNGLRGGQNAPQQQNGQAPQYGRRSGPNGAPPQQPTNQQNNPPQQNGQQIPVQGGQGQRGPGQQQGDRRGNPPSTPPGIVQGTVQQQNNVPAVQPPPQQGRPDFDRSQHTPPQRVEGNQPQQQRQTYTPPPQQQAQPQRTYTPPPLQQQRMEQTQPQRQNFPPPQAQQPRYSPPPPPPQQQPRFSPPPPPPQQQPHFSPPPPPPSPPPAPQISAPSPVSAAPLGRR